MAKLKVKRDSPTAPSQLRMTTKPLIEPIHKNLYLEALVLSNLVEKGRRHLKKPERWKRWIVLFLAGYGEKEKQNLRGMCQANLSLMNHQKPMEDWVVQRPHTWTQDCMARKGCDSDHRTYPQLLWTAAQSNQSPASGTTDLALGFLPLLPLSLNLFAH